MAPFFHIRTPMGSSHTKAERAHEARWRALRPKGHLNHAQRDFMVRQRTELESHVAQLYKLASHTLPESDIKKACRLAVLWGMTLKEMRKAYDTFGRMSSTMPRFCTVHEICIYFNVRRTALMELCLNHLYKSERLTFCELLETLAAFCTCDHMELLEALTLSCALRGESTIESVLTAIHGSPFEGNIEALLVLLGNLETLSTDCATYDRQLELSICSTDKLVELNRLFPTLLYPTFKLQAGLREKFLGNKFWNRLRQRMSELELRGMFSLEEYRRAAGRWEPQQVHMLSGAGRRARRQKSKRISSKSSVADILKNGAVERIRNYRLFQTCSVVDMLADDSCGVAWELTCSALTKTLAIEITLNDEETQAEANAILRARKCGRRTQLPGDPQIWVELTEGIYRPNVWRTMANTAGYAVSLRIKNGVQAYDARRQKQEAASSKILQEIARRGAGPGVQRRRSSVLGLRQNQSGNDREGEHILTDAQRQALVRQEQKKIDEGLERKQREEWDIYWRSFVDGRTERVFYFNYLTGERTWVKPRGFGRHLGKRRAKRRKSIAELEAEEEARLADIKFLADRADDVGSSGSRQPPTAKSSLSSIPHRSVGSTPSERRRQGRLQSTNKAQMLAAQKWGADSPVRKGRDTFGSERDRRANPRAAGEAEESVPLYEGNRITVVTGASAYRVVTEKAVITKVDQGKDGNSTFSVLYNDGFREDDVERVRVIAY